MIDQELLRDVAARVEIHVRNSKGFEEESFVNPFSPVDSVSAFAAARRLVTERDHDAFIAVAPEGHVYGFFFEYWGASVLSVHVGYPPRECLILDDLSGIRGRRVLILEDDVASGTTLRVVLDAIQDVSPKSVDLFLGRPRHQQILEHIDSRIGKTSLAEDLLHEGQQTIDEADFVRAFASPGES
ncbi:phosphoribosyltransferase domain-containing protein [Stieleria sp. ICT_E10.1]|uniref:phosphoribosyltransferase domain-containing protein n=1 Tax=Stieleria sedimenti TaxID=2976331 RepID=UPI00218046AF|nr:phosphoribosyltransferase domain-containing protein [Stieleria sedimenti]MCS7466932.1 phosphoribosyltransferase domain-containing protein [Stieleria sedimenti]